MAPITSWCGRFRHASSRRDETLCSALHRVHRGSGSRRRVRLRNVSLSASCRPLANEQPEAGMSNELTDEQTDPVGTVARLLADQRVALLACGMQRPPAGGWPHRVLAIIRRRVMRGTGQSRHRRPESAAFARTFSHYRDTAEMFWAEFLAVQHRPGNLTVLAPDLCISWPPKHFP